MLVTVLFIYRVEGCIFMLISLNETPNYKQFYVYVLFFLTFSQPVFNKNRKRRALHIISLVKLLSLLILTLRSDFIFD